MISEDLRSELDKFPFIPLRLHLVSGKTIDIPQTGMAWMLQNCVMIVQDPRSGDEADRYDVVSLRNIERVEQIRSQNRE